MQAGKLPNTQAGQVAFIVGYLQQLSNPAVAQAASASSPRKSRPSSTRARPTSWCRRCRTSAIRRSASRPTRSTPGSAALLSGISAAYNYLFVQNLTALGLLGTGKVIVVDAFTWQDQQLPNYKALGFTVSEHRHGLQPHRDADQRNRLRPRQSEPRRTG